MKAAYKKIVEKAKSQKKQTKKYLQSLKKKDFKNLDVIFKKAHNEIFADFNCLDCANCCQTLGPLLNNADIERISNYLGIKRDKFISTYLKIDEDNDYVFKQMPCSFLLEDNFCSIYDVRPKACKEYPHSDQKNMHNKLNLAIKNSVYCPALYNIIEKVKSKLN